MKKVFTHPTPKEKKGKIWHKIIRITMFSEILIIFQEEKNEKQFESILSEYKLTEQGKKDALESYGRNKDANGFVAEISEGRLFIVIFTTASKGTIAHEALHAAEAMCEYRRIPVSKDTEELRAMLVGEITAQAERLLLGNKK